MPVEGQLADLFRVELDKIGRPVFSGRSRCIVRWIVSASASVVGTGFFRSSAARGLKYVPVSTVKCRQNVACATPRPRVPVR
jgi:hypothetical protein